MGCDAVAGNPPALGVRHLSKRFGATLALDDVSFSIAPAEIHGLLGQNGSGKSTLIKILAGFHAPDPGGELEVAGRPVPLPLRPGDAHRLGVRFVHQDLGLLPSLSVLENLHLDELAARRGARISWPTERMRAADTLARHGLALDPRARVAALSPLERASVAIVRAIDGLESTGGGLLVLDEPTVFLSAVETDRLFALLRGIAERGASVLFVSHDLDEAREIAERVTVLRDGRVAATVPTAGTDEDALVELIVGRRLKDHQPAGVPPPGAGAIARARDVEGTTVRALTLELRSGEVVGLAGLPGSGYDELPGLLFGATRARSGRLELGSDVLDLRRLSPAAAVVSGIGFVPADRQRQGVVGSLSAADNVTLPQLDGYAARGRLDRRRVLGEAKRLLRLFDVRPPEPKRLVRTFSGGNQQKAILAKWLATSPRLLLLEEPTQGVDVGARAQILALVREAADRGSAVLCASTDYEQLEALCDRVLVFDQGRIAAEITRPQLTKDRIADACLRGDSAR